MKVIHPIIADNVSEYVKGILIIENYDNERPFILPLFANGTPTLVFQTTKGQIGNQTNYLTLFGQTVLPHKLITHGKFTLVAYFLQPHSLPALFNLNANELTDKPVDFNLLSQNSFLQEQLLNSKTIDGVISILNEYIFTLITKAKTEVSRIKYATEKISQRPGKHILAQIQKELCMTERSFQRMFLANVGVSPNQFRRINQFHKAFQLLNNFQFKNLSDIAYTNGYSDQSHFIKTFKEFTLITPKEYLANCNFS
jgi:AraC-like DNA-binding protein